MAAGPVVAKTVDVSVHVKASRKKGAATLKIETKGYKQWSLFLDANEARRIRDELDTIVRKGEKP